MDIPVIQEPAAAKRVTGDKPRYFRANLYSAYLNAFFDTTVTSGMGLSTADMHQCLRIIQERLLKLVPDIKGYLFADRTSHAAIAAIKTFQNDHFGTEEVNNGVAHRLCLASQPQLSSFRAQLASILKAIDKPDVSNQVQLEGITWPTLVTYRPPRAKNDPDPSAVPPISSGSTPLLSIKAELPSARQETKLSQIMEYEISDEDEALVTTARRRLELRLDEVETAAKRARLDPEMLAEIVSAAVIKRISNKFGQSHTEPISESDQPPSDVHSLATLYQRSLVYACVVCRAPDWWWNPNVRDFVTCSSCKRFHAQALPQTWQSWV
ncbi:hypothetical protein J8273_4496 [Carpediemonas membranifera]|uniref:Uncharacterized protein n=1 Tax=Carpediemonas membranifera TaxID=201153 RepID=A0A8J6B1U1_9EUKA|nr:hypothetical protein J8273_4496 [Carpediemonas membranifera]|eukprot:KAG9393903.1 hypothetical protein J8273_4496 [Carpediemonas membranifera]